MSKLQDFLNNQQVRDTAERLFWTVASAVLAFAAVEVVDLEGWYVMPLTGAINWLTIKVRQKLEPLPSPGEGLPGLPVEEAPVN